MLSFVSISCHALVLQQTEDTHIVLHCMPGYTTDCDIIPVRFLIALGLCCCLTTAESLSGLN